jgi:putative transposase
VNRKRVKRLMRVMGLAAIYAKPKLSLAGRGQRIFPYLLTLRSGEEARQTCVGGAFSPPAGVRHCRGMI